MEPTDAPAPTPEEEAAARRQRNLVIGVVVAVVLAVAVLLAVVLGGDDDGDVATDTSTTTSTTEGTTTSTTATTTTSSTATTATSTPTTAEGPGQITDEEAAGVVWPDPGGDLTYDGPAAAAEGFAVDLAGFTDPVMGEPRQGDARSAEVEVRARDGAPVTTVLVRQMSDDRWYVIGATTDDIVVDEPTPSTAIDSPLQVSGEARAFEGTVQVAVFERGTTEPLGEGFVTGSGGPDLGPFSGEVAWENPGGGWGVVLFWTESAEDGSVWQVVAIPVGFVGGD